MGAADVNSTLNSLAASFAEVLDAYVDANPRSLGEFPSLTLESRRRRIRRLRSQLTTYFANWRTVTQQAARHNRRELRVIPDDTDSVYIHTDTLSAEMLDFEQEVLASLLLTALSKEHDHSGRQKRRDRNRVSHAAATRVADVLAGPIQPPHLCFTLNVSPVQPVAIFDGWELSGCDVLEDSLVPLHWHDSWMPTSHSRRSYAGFDSASSPYLAHEFNGMGILRRRINSEGVLNADRSDSLGALVWPLLALNLFIDHDVRAHYGYFLDAGRQALQPIGGEEPIRSSATFPSYTFSPAEGDHWDVDRSPSEPFWRHWFPILSQEIATAVSLATDTYGSALASLTSKHRKTLVRAADQYLTVTYRAMKDDAKTPTAMETADATFRYVASIEAALTGDDHGDLTRKVAQRAAILIGRNDEDRLDVYGQIRAAYAARSAYVHGSRPKSVDLHKLETLTRRVLVHWPFVASKYRVNELPEVLDRALLSRAALNEGVRRHIESVEIDLNCNPYPISSRFR
jgi:hypothetical protein